MLGRSCKGSHLRDETRCLGMRTCSCRASASWMGAFSTASSRSSNPGRSAQLLSGKENEKNMAGSSKWMRLFDSNNLTLALDFTHVLRGLPKQLPPASTPTCIPLLHGTTNKYRSTLSMCALHVGALVAVGNSHGYPLSSC